MEYIVHLPAVKNLKQWSTLWFCYFEWSEKWNHYSIH